MLLEHALNAFTDMSSITEPARRSVINARLGTPQLVPAHPAMMDGIFQMELVFCQVDPASPILLKAATHMLQMEPAQSVSTGE